VSDPGAALVAAAHAAGARVQAAPGPSAAIAALSIAGLPMERFVFLGFPPRKPGERARFFAEWSAVPATLVLYESPQRIAATAAAAAEALSGRGGAIVREITKTFEEVRRGTLVALAEGCVADPPRGEIVLLIAPPDRQAAVADDAAVDAALRAALQSGAGVRDAAGAVAAALGAQRRRVYQRALALAAETP